MAEHILIVDDDPLLCNLFEITLRRKDYETQVAYSGKDALEYVESTPVDLILLDVMMADLNGFDVLRRLRENPALNTIPVVFLTARVDAISQKTGLDIGAVEYLTKPISPEALLERVQAVLAARK
ncbi:MAG: response regulator transcription factor [Chloroflexi bacterium]|nr:response regulator transcription factor [Chloroflexota bacterium]